MLFQRFTDEQLRAAINLDAAYRAWLESVHALDVAEGRMLWKTVGGRDYLYHVRGNRGQGRSLGPRSAETEATHAAFVEAKSRVKAELGLREPTLAQAAAVYRAMRLPMIESRAAEILLAADQAGVLGERVFVVGTHAVVAYELEAGGRFGLAGETQDLDFTWISAETPAEPEFWQVLKAVDPTYAVNAERPFQARNRAAYEVELLVGERRARTARAEVLKPIPLAEQDWLANGRPVDRVVCGLDGRPARMVVPDPRWQALHKLWLARKPGRNPLKRPKDERQGHAIWAAVRERMPHYPVDSAFVDALPDELKPLVP